MELSNSISGMSNYYTSTYNNTKSSEKANNATSALSGLSKDSSDEEFEKAVKSFETYMVEQVIKKVKDSITSINDDDDNSTISQYKDLYMDSAVTTLAEQLVDELGGSLTDDLVAQLKRNYNIDTKVPDSTEDLTAQNTVAPNSVIME